MRDFGMLIQALLSLTEIYCFSNTMLLHLVCEH